MTHIVEARAAGPNLSSTLIEVVEDSYDVTIDSDDAITINNPKTIELFFGTPFVNLTIYQLTINNVQDIAQNSMLPFSISISYFISQLPQFNDVIINEVFADPTPSIGLPEFEYIEFYNRTNTAIDLTDWSITIGTTEKQFPTSIIEPDSFVILIKEDSLDSFPNNISKKYETVCKLIVKTQHFYMILNFGTFF